ncbi:MAG: aminoacyl-tRNA hydrolase [Candidatus Woykebacteria bacterium]
MKLVVGLGNPGERYAETRHNIGFMVLDEIIKRYVASPHANKKLGAILYNLDKERLLLKPQTFMNRSGGPVANIVRFYKIKPENTLVVHDDVDLSFGEIKQQFARGAAGHRGVESIMEKLGTGEFNRVRVGIGRPSENMETDAWVLRNFSDEELEKLAEVTNRASQVIISWLEGKSK